MAWLPENGLRILADERCQGHAGSQRYQAMKATTAAHVNALQRLTTAARAKRCPLCSQTM